MQIQHLRYVLEVDRTGSISQSAQNLYMTQPNLSNAISELEEELGVQIFLRSSRGVSTTEEGARFISYAQLIVSQITDLERMYKERKTKGTTLRCAWAISAVESDIICRFINRIPPEGPVNIQLFETSHVEVLKAVIRREADVGKIYCPESNLEALERYAKNQGLELKKMWKMKSYIIFSENSKLAAEKTIHAHMLEDGYIQAVFRPAGMYDLPSSNIFEKRVIDIAERNVFFNDRGTLTDLLSKCPNVYMRAISPSPESLRAHNIVMRPHSMPEIPIVETVIYPKQPRSKEVKWFLDYLEEMKDPAHPHWEGMLKPIPLD